MLNAPHHGILCNHKQKDSSEVESENFVVLICEFTHFLESLIIGSDKETSRVNNFSLFEDSLVFLKVGGRVLLGGTDVGAESTFLSVNDDCTATSGLFSGVGEDTVHLDVLEALLKDLA